MHPLSPQPGIPGSCRLSLTGRTAWAAQERSGREVQPVVCIFTIESNAACRRAVYRRRGPVDLV